MSNPRSVVVTKPAGEGQLGDVEGEADVGVSCEGGQDSTDQQVPQEDKFYEKSQAKVRHDRASQALWVKLFCCCLTEREKSVPPGTSLHQLVEEPSVSLPVGVDHLARPDLVPNPSLQPQLLS